MYKPSSDIRTQLHRWTYQLGQWFWLSLWYLNTLAMPWFVSQWVLHIPRDKCPPAGVPWIGACCYNHVVSVFELDCSRNDKASPQDKLSQCWKYTLLHGHFLPPKYYCLHQMRLVLDSALQDFLLGSFIGMSMPSGYEARIHPHCLSQTSLCNGQQPHAH